MSYTQRLLNESGQTKLADFANVVNDKFNTSDLIKLIARETFNCTSKIINVNNDNDFKRSVKIAIAAKYVKPGDVKTINDLINFSCPSYESKIHDKLIRASKSIGTHVHKMTSTCIEDSANFFDKQTALSSGITSATVDSGRYVTGSKDGTLVAVFGLLSSTHSINGSEPLSIFERLANEEPVIIDTLTDLGADKEFISELIDSAYEHKNEAASNKISQFHKQNFINFGGKRIVVTPIQSVNTTVALKHAVNEIYEAKGRVNVKYYTAGGAQSQNVSALNQDLGGGIPHLKAWIPSQNKTANAFTIAAKTRNLQLNKEQRQLVSKLAWANARIEDKTNSNTHDRKIIENLFFKLSAYLVDDLEAFAAEINKLDDDLKLKSISDKMNANIKDYFNADSVKSKSDSIELIALEFVSKISAEMKRNKLNVNIETSAINTIVTALEKADIICQSL